MSGANGKKTPVSELVVGSSGLLLVLGVLGFLGYQEITQEESPPDITLHVEAIQPARSGYLMMIRAKKTRKRDSGKLGGKRDATRRQRDRGDKPDAISVRATRLRT
jgi:hypothetical protein